MKNKQMWWVAIHIHGLRFPTWYIIGGGTTKRFGREIFDHHRANGYTAVCMFRWPVTKDVNIGKAVESWMFEGRNAQEHNLRVLRNK